MPIGQRVQRTGGGLIHSRGPLRASAFAEPQVELLFRSCRGGRTACVYG